MIENIFELLCNWYNTVQDTLDESEFDTLYYVNDIYGIKLPYHYVKDILSYADELNTRIEELEDETFIQKDYIRLLRDERNKLHNQQLKTNTEEMKS